MTSPLEPPLRKLQFYVTTGYSCGYLPNKLAQSLIATPHQLITAEVYSSLIQQGFRRSGVFAYRPHCEHCQACIPVRVITQQFAPNRSQKRAAKQHQQLTTNILPAGFYEEHFKLYADYQKLRHCESLPDKAKDHPADDEGQDEAAQYKNFLCQTNVESLMVEFRDHGVLKMVSVIDVVADGLSAVYTFYDANDTSASYGTYNVLWQISWAKTRNLPYVYLGYWIAESQKMRYKQRFQPQQQLLDGEWL